MKKVSWFAAMALLISLLGSSIIPTHAQGNSVFLRVVHASPKAGAVSVALDGAMLFDKLTYKDVSGFKSVAGGQHQVTVAPVPASDYLYPPFAVDLSGGQGYYTLALFDDGSGSLKFQLFNDDLRTMPDGKARIGFINLSPGLGNANIIIDDKYQVDGGLSFATATGYYRLDAGSHSIYLARSGGTNFATTQTANLDAGKVYDFILAQVNPAPANQQGTVDLIIASATQQSGTGQVGDEPSPPLVPAGSIGGGQGTPSTPDQWYQAQYDPHFNYESGIPIGAIALNEGGDGWMARGDTLWTLQSGHLAASSFTFAHAAIDSIALSPNGQQGWAIGFNNGATGGAPPAVLLHYQNGAWSDASSSINATGVSFRLALDATANNGWAVGNSAPPANHPTLLQLSNGTWSDAASMMPTGAVLTTIATDLSNQHTWAGGFIAANHHPALYHLQDGKFVGGELGTDGSTIAAVTLDGVGDGWAVLSRPQAGNVTSPLLLRLHADGTMQPVANTAVDDAKVKMSQIGVDQNGNGWAFGFESLFSNAPPVAVIEKVSAAGLSDWQYQGPRAMQGPQEQIVFGAMTELATSSSDTAWASAPDGTLLRYGGLTRSGDVPSYPPAPNPAFTYLASGTPQCFANHHCLTSVFLTYWQQHGGLRQFGLPVTEPLLEKLDDGRIYTVQYTERARMEYHPENKDPYTVELGLLGDKLAKGRENETPFKPAAKVVDFYFPQTGHNLEGAIADYWMKNGALPVFGLPISEAFMEKSPTDGKTYLVQYFERNRLEYHPENSDPQYKVLLGLLGVQQFQANYGMLP